MAVHITYTGQVPLAVAVVGEWIPGESKELDNAALIDALLKRPDFSKTPKPVPARVPRKPAKADAEAKSTPRSV